MQEDTENETKTINLDIKLKRKIEEYNFKNRKNKINVSKVCRDALWEELRKRGVEE